MSLIDIYREMVLSVIQPDNNFYDADLFRKNIQQQCKLTENQCQSALDRLVDEGVLNFYPSPGGKVKRDRYKCSQAIPEMEEAKQGARDLHYFHRKILLSLIPENGEPVSNDELMTKSGLGESDEDDYWAAIDRLVEEGVIVRGGGVRGSVARVTNAIDISDESELYEPFRQVVENAFGYQWAFTALEHRVETTAEVGPRRRGIFTRPDVTLLIMRTSKYSPGKRLEVITFELKTSSNWDDASAFEASGHRRFSHFSWLVIHLPCGVPAIKHEQWRRVVQTCNHMGVGLMTCREISDYSTYDTKVEAVLSTPDPALVDDFIEARISDKGKRWLQAFCS